MHLSLFPIFSFVYLNGLYAKLILALLFSMSGVHKTAGCWLWEIEFVETYLGDFHVIAGLFEPCSHVIQNSMSLKIFAKNQVHILSLLRSAKLRTYKRRIANYIIQLVLRNNLVPVDSQSIRSYNAGFRIWPVTFKIWETPDCYNNKRIKAKLKRLSPMQYRLQSLSAA